MSEPHESSANFTRSHSTVSKSPVTDSRLLVASQTIAHEAQRAEAQSSAFLLSMSHRDNSLDDMANPEFLRMLAAPIGESKRVSMRRALSNMQATLMGEKPQDSSAGGAADLTARGSFRQASMDSLPASPMMPRRPIVNKDEGTLSGQGLEASTAAFHAVRRRPSVMQGSMETLDERTARDVQGYFHSSSMTNRVTPNMSRSVTFTKDSDGDIGNDVRAPVVVGEIHNTENAFHRQDSEVHDGPPIVGRAKSISGFLRRTSLTTQHQQHIRQSGGPGLPLPHNDSLRSSKHLADLEATLLSSLAAPPAIDSRASMTGRILANHSVSSEDIVQAASTGTIKRMISIDRLVHDPPAPVALSQPRKSLSLTRSGTTDPLRQVESLLATEMSRPSPFSTGASPPLDTDGSIDWPLRLPSERRTMDRQPSQASLAHAESRSSVIAKSASALKLHDMARAASHLSHLPAVITPKTVAGSDVVPRVPPPRVPASLTVAATKIKKQSTLLDASSAGASVFGNAESNSLQQRKSAQSMDIWMEEDVMKEGAAELGLQITENSLRNAIASLLPGFLVFFVFMSALVLMLVAGFYISGSHELLFPDGISYPHWSHFFAALLQPTVAQARLALHVAAIVDTTVMLIVFPMTAILLEYASNELSPDVNQFFATDPRLILTTFVWVFTTLFTCFVSFVCSETYLPRGDVILALALSIFSVLLLPFFFVSLVSMLRPKDILLRMLGIALLESDRNSLPTKDEDVQADSIITRQLQVCSLLESAAAMAQGSIRRKDKTLAYFAVENIRKFSISYGQQKAAWQASSQLLSRDWFVVPDLENPDNFGLSNRIIDDMRQKGTWVEWKILRQYQGLFNDAMSDMPDLCYVIAVNAKKMSIAAARRGDFHALDLFIKFFNTFMRVVLNARNVRLAFSLLNQYRSLNEALVQMDAEGAKVVRRMPHLAKNYERLVQLDLRCVQIAKFLFYYTTLAIDRDMLLFPAVVAQDMVTCVEHALYSQRKCHDDLMDIFLDLGRHIAHRLGSHHECYRGYKKAHLKLACIYAANDAQLYLECMWEEMRDDPIDLLVELAVEIEEVHSAEFFEVSDRPTNLDYCPPKHRVRMSEVIEGLRDYLAEEGFSEEEEEEEEEDDLYAYTARRASLLPEV